MKTRNLLFGITICLAMTAIAFAVPGQGGPRRGGPGEPGSRGGQHDRGSHGMGRMLANPKVAEALGLSEEQTEELKKMHFKTRSREIDLQADVEKAKLKVHELMRQDEPAEDEVMSALDDAGAAQLALHKAKVKHMLKVRSLLGADKMKKIKEMARKHQGRRSPNGRHGEAGRGGSSDHRGRTHPGGMRPDGRRPGGRRPEGMRRGQIEPDEDAPAPSVPEGSSARADELDLDLPVTDD